MEPPRALSEKVEITVGGSHVPRLHRAVVHRSQVFGPVDRRTAGGVPVTRRERTLIDAAAALPEAVVSGYLESAVASGLTTLDRIWSYLSRYGGPGRRGSGLLRRMLAERDPAARPTESGLEDRVVVMLRQFGLQAAVRQHPFGPYRLDLAYPRFRVAVEVDSAR